MKRKFTLLFKIETIVISKEQSQKKEKGEFVVFLEAIKNQNWIDILSGMYVKVNCKTR